jgi:1-acyl-sn-glycerol-3-phosphate acyltransferase
MGLFYFAANSVMKALLVLLTRWRVEGKENVPRQGPVIIVSNHLSIIDPPLLGASVPRRIRFMAKQELFDFWFARIIVEAYGGFPVRRGQLDRAAVRRALEGLQSGCVLGMFPEGKRSHNGQLQSAQLGASLIASRAGVLILPVGIFGSEKVRGMRFVLRRPRVTVNIGRPFTLPEDGHRPARSRLADHTDLIMDRVAELLPQGYRGPDRACSNSRSGDGG